MQYEGDSLIPVRTRRILQFLDKYVDIGEDGAAWMRTIRYQRCSEDGIHVNECSESTSFEEKQQNELLNNVDQNNEKSENPNKTDRFVHRLMAKLYDFRCLVLGLKRTLRQTYFKMSHFIKYVLEV